MSLPILLLFKSIIYNQLKNKNYYVVTTKIEAIRTRNNIIYFW